MTAVWPASRSMALRRAIGPDRYNQTSHGSSHLVHVCVYESDIYKMMTTRHPSDINLSLGILVQILFYFVIFLTCSYILSATQLLCQNKRMFIWALAELDVKSSQYCSLGRMPKTPSLCSNDTCSVCLSVFAKALLGKYKLFLCFHFPLLLIRWYHHLFGFFEIIGFGCITF